MGRTDKILRASVETYLEDLGRIRSSGGATNERSYYPSLSNLLNAVGSTLSPKVFCVVDPANQGAGFPDINIYAAHQIQKGIPRKGQMPERGVVEVKPATEDAWVTAEGEQVSRYWGKYRLVLVTNTRDFVLLGEDEDGKPVKLETFRLAETVEVFESRLGAPRSFAQEISIGLGEYLSRALSHRATVADRKGIGLAACVLRP